MNSWTITMTSYKALCTVQEGEVWDKAPLPPLQGLPANISRLCADLKATTVLNLRPHKTGPLPHFLVMSCR